MDKSQYKVTLLLGTTIWRVETNASQHTENCVEAAVGGGEHGGGRGLHITLAIAS